MANSSPAKVSVECPHCGFKQMEYAAAKSTMCRQCGQHFAPAAPKQPVIRISLPKATEPIAAANELAGSLMDSVSGLWKQQRNTVIECFECKAKQEVSGAANSTICPACSAHIDLQDYKITNSFSRSIRTHGEVHVTPRGDLSSSSVICRSATVEGKLRGNLKCIESANICFSGKMPGQLTAHHVVVDRKADVQFFRRISVKSIEVRGRMSGEIKAEGVVVIHKTGYLEGSVVAKGITVEKGGVFSGQLAIGQKGLTQAELLPAVDAEEPAKAKPVRVVEVDPGLFGAPVAAAS